MRENAIERNIIQLTKDSHSDSSDNDTIEHCENIDLSGAELLEE
jgi:hypothetical protein